MATDEIKEVTLKYCVKNLKKDATKKVKEKEIQEELHRLRMEEKDNEVKLARKSSTRSSRCSRANNQQGMISS